MSHLTTGLISLNSSINLLKIIHLSSVDKDKIHPTDNCKLDTIDQNNITENNVFKQLNEKQNRRENKTNKNETIDFDNDSYRSEEESILEQGIIYINTTPLTFFVGQHSYKKGEIRF